MNERIKQLAEQATDEVGLNPNVFAELIVQECIDQCADHGSNDEWDKGVRWAANQIKEHFGVEE
jgi:hypothetical protein